MRMVDFEYDGIRLSDKGYGICNFDGGDDSQDIGNALSLNNIKAQNRNDYFLSNAAYEDVFAPEFQICKIACGNDSDFVLSADDMSFIMRWLNRKKYLKFKPIYDDESFSDVYYMGTFNVSIIKLAGRIIGLTLQFKTNAPYGFGDDVTASAELSSITDKMEIENASDEIGNIYCDVEITCNGAGDLEISNSADPNNVVSVKNCQKDEVIKMYGSTKIIESSLAGHTKLYNDFNYNYLRIVNSFENRANKFTSTIPCTIKITYTPIRKVGFVV